MNKRIALILNILFCLLIRTANAQEIPSKNLSHKAKYSLRNYNVENGLPSSEVYDVVQGSDGYMWFTTDRGVSKFNGYDFINYTTKDGLLDNVNFEIIKDAKDRIWILSIGGALCYFEKNNFIEYAYNDVLTKNLPKYKYSNSIFIDTHENVHFGSLGNGLITISKDGILKKINNESNPYNITIANIEDNFFTYKCDNQTSNDVLNYFFKDSIILKSTQHFNLIRTKAYLHADSLLCFNTPKSIVIYNINSSTISNQIFFDNRITSFDRSNDGDVFVGTENSGLYIYKIKNEEFIIKQHVLKTLTISSCLKDLEGGYWITTTQEGVFYTPSFNIISFDKSHGLINNYINELNIYNNSLAISYGDSMQFLESSKLSNPINLSINNKQNINSNNFNLVKDKCDLLHRNKKLYNFCDDFIYPNLVKCGLASIISLNKIIYIFTKSYGIKYKNDEFSEISLNAKNTIIEDVEIINENSFWIGTRGGLIRQNNGVSYDMANEDSLFKKRIVEIEFNSKKELIVATRGAGVLIRKADSNLININAENGLITNDLTCLHVDEKDNIWVATNQGLHMLNANNYFDVEYFSMSNGLISNEITDIKSIRNKIYIGTKKGLSIIDLETFKVDTSEISLRMLNVELNGIKIDFNQTIDLYPGNKKLDIHFLGLNYKSLGEIQYKYRFNGLSKKWNYTKNQIISLHSLPESGEVSLEISARKLPQGEWTLPIITQFILHPPFYKTWWFIISIGLFIVGVIYLAFKVNIIAYNKHIQHAIVQRILENLGKKSYLTIEADKTKTRIDQNNILYIQAHKDYIEIHIIKKVFLYRSTMKNIEQKLKNSNIVRVHRSYMVNVNKIDSIGKEKLNILDKTIPIGVTYQEKLKKLSTQFSKLNL